MLVVAPPTVVWNWEDEIVKHSNIDNFTIVDGTSASKTEMYEESNSEITVVSHHWFVQYLKKHKKVNKKFDMLVIDEAHLIRNPFSVGFKMFKEHLSDISNIYLMTGTPIGNSLDGFWSLYYMIDKGRTFGDDFLKFRSKYFFDVSRDIRYSMWRLRKNKYDEFNRLIWDKMIRYEEKECMDLPGKIKTTISVPRTDKQIKQHELRVDSAKRFDGNIIPDLLMIAAGADMENSPKISATCDIVKDAIEYSPQILIWHWLRAEGKLLEKSITKKFPNLKIGAYNGAMSAKDKKETMRRWRDGKINVMITNIQSLSTGVTLHESSVSIYFSNTMAVIDRQQSEKRIHRYGQKKVCRYFDVVTKGGMDEIMLKKLRASRKNFDYVMRAADVWEEIGRENK